MSSFLDDLIGGTLMSLAIGVPFGLYFYIYGA